MRLTVSRRLVCVALAAGALCGPPAWQKPAWAVDMTKPQPNLAREKLVIVTHDNQRHDFQVEVATSMDQQEVGLMWRPAVPDDGGMLFDWGRPRSSQMWMKNTVVSLDMLFIDETGVVRHIAERTTPRSLAVIDGVVPVRATLELAAGTAERLDIRVGDRVEQRIFTAAAGAPVAATAPAP